MEDTGRIPQGLAPSVRRIVFGSSGDDAIDAEMEHITQVDRAHVVMLAESKIVDPQRANALLTEIDRLRSCRFAPLRGRPASRGVYMLYEDYLIETLGIDTGGVLQTGRSRNDLSATTLRLRLRKPYLRLLRASLGLQSVLLHTGATFSDLVMPAYTHYQAAVPITYGHYLTGVAEAVTRDIDWLFESAVDLCRCPLGAGAVGGTSWPIKPQRTSELLGFEAPALNSVDAVASRDVVLRLLAAAAVLGITLSRLAADLLLWTTAEFGFLALPDNLVGSSSMMPQKRNPFLLEHIQGRSATALGAFAAAAACMHGKPFTNSIAVGTEAPRHIWGALRDATEIATLARLVVRGAEPQRQNMLRRAVEGQTVATEIANRLVTRTGISYRAAHRAVGAILREADSDVPISGVAAEDSSRKTVDTVDPLLVVQASKYGGGPAPGTLATSLGQLNAHAQAQRDRVWRLSQTWRKSNVNLNHAVKRIQSRFNEVVRGADRDGA